MDSALSKRKSRLSSSGKIVDYNDWEIVAKIFQLLDKSMGSPEKKKFPISRVLRGSHTIYSCFEKGCPKEA